MRLLPVNDNSIRRAAATEVSTFRLSRIFAEGWNAARELSTEATDELTLRAMTSRNPYGNEPERSRWVEGFTKALDD